MARIGWKTTWEAHYKYLKKTHPTHEGSVLSLVANLGMGKDSVNDPITVFVSLQGTSISPGDQIANSDSERGYYQDRITVTMELDHPQLLRVSDSPQTHSGRGSVVSSVTVSSGASVGAGFFGSTPTGNIGFNSQRSDTNAFSRELTDFHVRNASDSHKITHDYLMGLTGEGTPYSHPADIVNNHTIHTLPDLAIADFPIISQAAWQSNSNAPINETVILKICIKQYMVKYGVEWSTRHSLFGKYDESHTSTSDWFTKIVKFDLFKLTGQQGDPL